MHAYLVLPFYKFQEFFVLLQRVISWIKDQHPSIFGPNRYTNPVVAIYTNKINASVKARSQLFITY